MTDEARQLTMFGVPSEPETVFNVYHDESGTYAHHGGDRWLLHGVLFVPQQKQERFYNLLMEVRHKYRYYGEVHFVGLRSHVKGPKAQCIRAWLQSCVLDLSDYCSYHCLAIDTCSQGFDRVRFGQPYHVYNYFARVAVLGGIAWSMKKHPRVALKLHSDAKFHQMGDNFANYVPRELLVRISEKRSKKPSSYPRTRLLCPEVLAIESDPAKAGADVAQECELVQLTDVMTSSIAQALSATSDQEAKVSLAELVAQWIEDTRRPPWLQDNRLHRRFSLSCYPNEKGEFYHPILEVTTRDQLRLL